MPFRKRVSFRVVVVAATRRLLRIQSRRAVLCVGAIISSIGQVGKVLFVYFFVARDNQMLFLVLLMIVGTHKVAMLTSIGNCTLCNRHRLPRNSRVGFGDLFRCSDAFDRCDRF